MFIQLLFTLPDLKMKKTWVKGMRCIHYVGRISASSVSFPVDPLATPSSHSMWLKAATHPQQSQWVILVVNSQVLSVGRVTNQTCVLGSQELFKGWGTSANKPGWLCSYHIGSDVGCIVWKSLQWFWYDSSGPSVSLEHKPFPGVCSSLVPWKCVFGCMSGLFGTIFQEKSLSWSCLPFLLHPLDCN